MSILFSVSNETLTQAAFYLELVLRFINSQGRNPYDGGMLIDRSNYPIFYWENDADPYHGNGKKNLYKIFKKVSFSERKQPFQREIFSEI